MNSAETAEIFQKLVGEVEEALGIVEKQIAEHNFQLEEANLEIQAIIEEGVSAGGGFTAVIVPISAGYDYQETTLHTIVMSLKTKPPAVVLGDTSRELVAAILAAFGAVSQLDQHENVLTPTDVHVKVRFELTESWSLKVIFGYKKKHVAAHAIELHFKRRKTS
jgi:hypothetical protein